MILIKGSVSGTEFAPSHFQTREFSFYEIPIVHLQITPIHRSTTTNTVTTQIRTKGWIQVPRGQQPDQWHLVRLSRGPSTTPAIASLLTDELELSVAGGTPFWKSWNADHPNRAAVLWPVVQRLSDRELYLMIPELLMLARSQPGNDDGQLLAEAIDTWLIEQYVGLIGDLRDADRTTLADQMLAEAIRDYPDAPQLAALKLAALKLAE